MTATRYAITVEGHLDQPHWQHWFEGLHIDPTAEGTTVLSGPVVDQAALYGLLERVRDLGLPLIAIQRLED